MEKPIQTDMLKCKMSTQIKSLSQKEVLLPVSEGKCALSLLDQESRNVFFFHMRFLAVRGVLVRPVSVIDLGQPTEMFLKFILTSKLFEYLIFTVPC